MMDSPHATLESSASEAQAWLVEVLVRTGHEDRAAFRDLYALTAAKLFGICYRICGENPMAEEVLHDVYLTIWKRASGYEPHRESPLMWLASIARNGAIDASHARRVRRATSIPDAPPIPDDAPLVDAASHWFHNCLDGLEGGQRAAIRGAFFDGLTYAELAERQQVSLGTMKDRVRSGLARLKECLGGMRDDCGRDNALDMAAAELALGLAEGDDRAHALHRVLVESGFAREVEHWHTRFEPLFELWPPIAAPTGVLARIEWTIDGPGAMLVQTPRRHRWFWPAAAGLSSIAAAAMLLFIMLRPIDYISGPARPGPTTPIAAAPATILVASLEPVEGGTPVTAVYNPVSGGLRLTAATRVDADRSAELWVIAGDDVAHSLGLLQASGASLLPVNPSNRARFAAGATLAISLEPMGGSPSGVPTGPFIAKGALSPV